MDLLLNEQLKLLNLKNKQTMLSNLFLSTVDTDIMGTITRSSVLQLEVLIRKLPPIDGLPSSSIVISKVTSLKTHMTVIELQHHIGKQKTQKRTRGTYLAHELRNHPVEGRPLVTKAMFPCAQCPEVFCRKDSGQILSDNPNKTLNTSSSF